MPIAKEELDANQLEFERHVASVLLAGLSEGGQSVEEIERMIDMPEGGFKTYISQLIDGKTGVGKPMVEILYAMGLKARIGFTRTPGVETAEEA